MGIIHEVVHEAWKFVFRRVKHVDTEIIRERDGSKRASIPACSLFFSFFFFLFFFFFCLHACVLHRRLIRFNGDTVERFRAKCPSK